MKIPTVLCLLSWISLWPVEKNRVGALVPSTFARTRSATPNSPSSLSTRNSAITPRARWDVPFFKRKHDTLSLDLKADVISNDEEKDDAEAETHAGALSDSNSSMKEKVVGRKIRLQLGYRVSSFVYLAASAFHLYRRGVNASSLYYVFGGGTFTMAAVLNILTGAARHDRLSSDTYKRLNLAVITSAVFHQLMPFRGLGFSDRLFFKGPALLALINGVKGYGYGVLGWDKSNKEKGVLVADLKVGIQSTVHCLTVVKAGTVGYLFGTYLLGIMSAAEIWKLCSLALSSAGGGNAPLMILSRLSRSARLCLMTTVLYTLKDAADRDRLSGSTFVRLNYVASVALASMGAYYMIPITSGKAAGDVSQAILTAVAAGGLSAMTFLKGAERGAKKNEKE